MQAVTFNAEDQSGAYGFALLVPVDTPSPADTPSEILSPADDPPHDILIRPLDEQVKHDIHILADEHHKDPTMSLEHEDRPIGVETSSDDVAMKLFMSPDAESIDTPALVDDDKPMDLSTPPENQSVRLPTPTEEIPLEVLLPSNAASIDFRPPADNHKSTGCYFVRAVDPTSRDQGIKPLPPTGKEPINPLPPKDDVPNGPLTPADDEPVGFINQYIKYITLRDKLADLITICNQEITIYTLTEDQADDFTTVDDEPMELMSAPTHGLIVDPSLALNELMVAIARVRADTAHYPREVPREDGYRYRFIRNAIATIVRPQSRIMHGVDELMYNTAMARLEPEVPSNIEYVNQVPLNVDYANQVPPNVEHSNEMPLNVEYVNQAPLKAEYIDEEAPVVDEYVDHDEPRAKRLRVEEKTEDMRETDGVQETDGAPDISDQRRLLEIYEIESQRHRMIDAIQLTLMINTYRTERGGLPPIREETPVREKMQIREAMPHAQLPDLGVEDHQMFDQSISLESLNLQEQYEIFQVPEVQEKIFQVPEAQEESQVPEAQFWDPEGRENDSREPQLQDQGFQAPEVQIWNPEVYESKRKAEIQKTISGVPEVRGGRASMYYFGGSKMELRGSQAEVLVQGWAPQTPAVQEGEPQIPEVQVCDPEAQSYESQEPQVHRSIPQVSETQEGDFQVPQVNVEGSSILEAQFGDLELDRYEHQEPQALTELSEDFPDWDLEGLIRFESEEPVLMQNETSQTPEARKEWSQVLGSEEETLPVPRVDLEWEVPNESQELQQGLKEMPEGPESLDEGLKSLMPDLQYDDLEAQKMHEGQKSPVYSTMYQVPEAQACDLETPIYESQGPYSQVSEAQEEEPPMSVIKSEDQGVHSEMYQVPQAQAYDLETPRYESQGPHSQMSEAQEEEHILSVIKSEGQEVQRDEDQEPHMPKELSQALETQEKMRQVLGAREESQLLEIEDWYPVIKRRYLQEGGRFTSSGPEVVQVWHNEIQRYESDGPQSSGTSQTPETQEEQPSQFPGVPNWFPDRPRFSQEPLQVWGHQSQRSDSQQSQTSRETSLSQVPRGLEQRPQLHEAQLGDPEMQRYETQGPRTSRVISQMLEIQVQERARQIPEAREEESQLPRVRDRYRRAEGPAEGEASRMSEAQEEPETNVPGIQEWFPPIEAEAHRMSEERQVSEAREEVCRASEALEEARQVLEAREEARRISEAWEESQLPGTQDLYPEPRRYDSHESQESRETPQTPEAQEGRLPVSRMHGAREVSKPQE